MLINWIAYFLSDSKANMLIRSRKDTEALVLRHHIVFLYYKVISVI